jgi:transitional endoplasmic reticulum ATPase
MREFMVEIPSTRWSDIGGLEKPKQLLSESVTFAVRRRALLDAIGLRLTRGILLYGPPGTGKTLLGRAAARECGANFIYVKGPEIRSKWYGESEARIRLIFERAAQCAPCIVFIDEIDSIAAARGTSVGSASDRADASVVNQLLAEMDGVQAAAGVLVIGATNMPDLLDPALLRPGRFDYQIDIPLPDPASRRAILDVHLAKKPVAPDLDWDVLIRLTHGFSGAELEEVCRDAALAALRETDFDVSRTQVNMEHMKAAVARVLENASKLKPRRIGFAADSGDKGQGPEGAS